MTTDKPSPPSYMEEALGRAEYRITMRLYKELKEQGKGWLLDPDWSFYKELDLIDTIKRLRAAYGTDWLYEQMFPHLVNKETNA